MPSTVLVVENDPGVRATLEALLPAAGLRVIGTADSPEAGLPLWKAHRPDVSIVDLEMGDASGADLARDVLRLDAAAQVLVYTGCADEAKLQLARESGARVVIAKSASFTELLAEVQASATAARDRPDR